MGHIVRALGLWRGYVLVISRSWIGRRVCVGWNVAHRNMFIVFARILYCFDFFEDAVQNHAGTG